MRHLRRLIAGFLTASLVFLAGHDIVQACQEPATGGCQICVLVARTAPHTPKAAPQIAVVSVSLELPAASAPKPARLRRIRQSSRAPPAA